MGAMTTPANYLAFARKYRPRTFEDVIGQEAIAQALRAAVASARTASVYLFSGSHGVGKTSMARILAKALECPQATDGRPCLTCEVCQSVDRGEAFDVLEIDAASNRGVEDAERIRQNVRTRGSGRFKIYILDEVHQLSRQAFDALLKTFEEAPEHVRFILATTELHKVPPTIRSRAQVFHFHRSTREAVEGRLRQIADAEQVPIDPAAITLISRRARGSMRDAQKLLDQVVSLGGAQGALAERTPIRTDDVANLLGTLAEDRVERVLASLAAASAGPLLEELDDYLQKGGRPGTFIEDLQEAMRAVLYLKACGAQSPLLEEVAYDQAALTPVATALSEEAILYSLTILQDAEVKMRTAREPRIVLEVCLVRMARMAELRPIGEVLARLERLEAALEGGGAPARPARPESPAPSAPSAPRAKPSPRADEPATDRAPGPRSSVATSDAPGGRRSSYSYPGAPGGGPSPELTARGVVELDRAARLDRPASPSSPADALQGSGGGVALAPPPVAVALSQTAAERAWASVQGALPEALGMTATLLERGQPRVRVEQGDLVVEINQLSDLMFAQLADPKIIETLAGILAGPLGAPPKVRFRRVAQAADAAPGGTPQQQAPQQQRGGGGGGGGGGGRSVYDDPIVKAAQRELAATPISRED
jgi:DNA polymerase-3 subunit gamma/tau